MLLSSLSHCVGANSTLSFVPVVPLHSKRGLSAERSHSIWLSRTPPGLLQCTTNIMPRCPCGRSPVRPLTLPGCSSTLPNCTLFKLLTTKICSHGSTTAHRHSRPCLRRTSAALSPPSGPERVDRHVQLWADQSMIDRVLLLLYQMKRS